MFRFSGGGNLRREGGFRGGHVNKDATGTEAMKGARGGVQKDLADVGREADDGEDDVGLGRDGEWRLS